MANNPYERQSDLMDYSELALYLSVSESYLRRMVMKRSIPYIKIGRSVRFKKQRIEAWLDERTIKS